MFSIKQDIEMLQRKEEMNQNPSDVYAQHTLCNWKSNIHTLRKMS